MFGTVVDAIRDAGDPATLTTRLPDDPDRRTCAILAELMDLEAARAMLEARVARLQVELAETARSWVWPPDLDEDTVLDEAVTLASHELAPALRLSPVTAGLRIRFAQDVIGRFPRTWAAWAAGDLDTGRVRAITDACLNLTAAECARVEKVIHPKACDQTAAELRAALRKHVITIAPDHAERARKRATKGRRVEREHLGDGTGALHAYLSSADVAEMYDLVDQLARESTYPGDQRGMDQRRADALTQLVTGHAPALGPEGDPDDPHHVNTAPCWDTGDRCQCGRPCTGHTTPSADDQPGDDPGDDEPGDSDDQPGDGDGGGGNDLPDVDGDGGSASPAEPDDEQVAEDIPSDDHHDVAERPDPVDEDEPDHAAACWPDHTDDQTRDEFMGEIDRRRAARARRLAEQERAFDAALARRRKPAPPWAVINPVAGPDGQTVQVGEVEDIGPVTAAYARHLLDTGRARAPAPRPDREPSPQQRARHDPPGWLDTWVRQRDGTCRAPGCRRTARRCDDDHTTEFPRGLTAEGNLGALCRTHHRTKAHWHVTQDPETAVFTWRSRHTGRTYVTTPRGTTGDWTGAQTIT